MSTEIHELSDCEFHVGPDRDLVMLVERAGVRYFQYPPFLCPCPLTALALPDLFDNCVVAFWAGLANAGIDAKQIFDPHTDQQEQIRIGYETYLRARDLAGNGGGQAVLDLMADRLMDARERGDQAAVTTLQAHMRIVAERHTPMAVLARTAMVEHRMGVLISALELHFTESICVIGIGLALHLNGGTDHTRCLEEIREQHEQFRVEADRTETEISGGAAVVSVAAGIEAPFSRGVVALMDILGVHPDFNAKEAA